ncbi:MAG: leucine-rich repeat domain-containing protein [Prevotellaceae bacterium]|nr:leucine-rich repeat domain-containing protein [Candidatus Minthosoma caballi]
MKQILLKSLLVMLTALLSLPILAYDFEVDGIYYKINNEDNKTVSVDKCESYYKGDVVIPSIVEYNGTTYSVACIGDYAFSDCSSLTSIVIPESVTSIGDEAFDRCSSLTSVNIPSSVKSIGAYTFGHCSSLSSIAIPESVTSIGQYAFYDCSSLTSIVIPESVTSIGNNAFEGCSGLSSIVIPESVTRIRYGAFAGVKLKSVIVKCRKVPSTVAEAFSNPTYYHAPLYVRAELYDDYAFNDGWCYFINIKKYVDNADNLESSKAYFLMNEANIRYIVYDSVNDKITTRESVADVDEENLNDNWTVVKMDGKQYLYNMGAKKFAKRDASEIGFSLVEDLTDMNGAAMRKTAAVSACANILFIENGSLSADEAAKDIVTGIELVNAERGNEASIHSISGVKQPSLSHGINIIRMGDGSVKKVLVK